MLDTTRHTNSVNFIEVYGLRRSGNHAIIAWLMHNLNSDGIQYNAPEPLIVPNPEWGFISQRLGDVYHINDAFDKWATAGPGYIKGLVDAYSTIGAKTIIISYEDKSFKSSLLDLYAKDYPFLKKTTKIVITRNILDIVASRIKRMRGANRIPSTFGVDKRTIETWIENESFTGTKIQFEQWCTSKEYRDSISQSIGLSNLDITSHVSTAGKGSSFLQPGQMPDKSKLLNRRAQVSIPMDIIKIYKELDIYTRLKELNYS